MTTGKEKKDTKKEKVATPTPGKKKWTIADLAQAQKAIDAAVGVKDKLEKCYDMMNAYQRLVDEMTLSLEAKVVDSDVAGIKEKFTHVEIDGVEIGKEEYDKGSVILKLTGLDKTGLHDAVLKLKSIGNKGLKTLIYHSQADYTAKQIDQTEGHGAKEDKKDKQENLI